MVDTNIIQEMYVTNRERYIDEPDSIECIEQAASGGIGAIFYTWPINNEDDI